MDPLDLSLTLPNEDATSELGRNLAAQLLPGDTVLLSGEIGAGKSTLARALIRTKLNDPEAEVPSPTFTLVQPYATAGGEIWHCDLYRLGDPDELIELGLDSAIGTALCLIEWPERLTGTPLLSPLKITMQTAGSGRIAQLSGDADWARRLKGFHG